MGLPTDPPIDTSSIIRKKEPMTDSYFVAVNPSCGHTRVIWAAELTDPIDAAHHAKQLKSCEKRGLVVVQMETREEAVSGVGKDCDTCRSRKP